MGRKRQTWAATHNFKATKRDPLIKYMKYAIHLTCRRTGWDWAVSRETDSFSKLETILLSDKGDWIVSVDFYFDLKTRGKLFRYHIAVNEFNTLAFMREGYVVEARAFLDAAVDEIARQLKAWLELHPEDRDKIAFLAGAGKYSESKKERAHPRTSNIEAQTEEVGYSLNRALEAEQRKKMVAEAIRLRNESPRMAWKEIAKTLDIPERTLREWRHNPHYQ